MWHVLTFFFVRICRISLTFDTINIICKFISQKLNKLSMKYQSYQQPTEPDALKQKICMCHIPSYRDSILNVYDCFPYWRKSGIKMANFTSSFPTVCQILIMHTGGLRFSKSDFIIFK